MSNNEVFTPEQIKSLSDLPNELLIKIFKNRSADEYVQIAKTSATLMKRLESINQDMFRYYLKSDFNVSIPATFDARTAYMTRKACPLVRFVSVLTEETNHDGTLVVSYPRQLFFIESSTISLEKQVVDLIRNDFRYTLDDEANGNGLEEDGWYHVQISDPITGMTPEVERKTYKGRRLANLLTDILENKEPSYYGTSVTIFRGTHLRNRVTPSRDPGL